MAHIEHQNRFFREYQVICQMNPQRAVDDRRRWDAAKPLLHVRPLNAQAEYADYVIRGVCSMNDEEVMRDLAKDIGEQLEHNTDRLEASVRGGIALILLTLRKFPSLQLQYQQLLALFQKQPTTRRMRPTRKDSIRNM